MKPPPIILVHLRRPDRRNPDETRTDPLYEFGSFGLTDCHRTLLKRRSTIGSRLGFVQPGRGEMRLVYLSPPVKVVDHGKRREGGAARAERYWESMPSPLPKPDKHRKATHERLLAEAREKPPEDRGRRGPCQRSHPTWQ